MKFYFKQFYTFKGVLSTIQHNDMNFCFYIFREMRQSVWSQIYSEYLCICVVLCLRSFESAKKWSYMLILQLYANLYKWPFCVNYISSNRNLHNLHPLFKCSSYLSFLACSLHDYLQKK